MFQMTTMQDNHGLQLEESLAKEEHVVTVLVIWRALKLNHAIHCYSSNSIIS